MIIKSRRAVLFLTAVLGVTGVWLLGTRVGQDDEKPVPVERTGAARPRVHGGSTIPSVIGRPATSSEISPAPTVAAFPGWREFPPAQMLAAFELTADPLIRKQLAELDPMPTTVLAVLAMTSGSDAEKAAWARQWILQDPANGAGYILLAASSPEDLDRCMNQLGKLKTLDLYSLERNLEVAGLYQKNGQALPPRDLLAETIPQTAVFIEDSMEIVKFLISDGRDRYEAATDVIGLTRILQARPDLRAGQYLLASGMEAAALRDLPADTPYGEDGMTTGERRAEIASEGKAAMAVFEEAEAAFEKSDGVTKELYFRRLLLHGELEAAKWLLQAK